MGFQFDRQIGAWRDDANPVARLREFSPAGSVGASALQRCPLDTRTAPPSGGSRKKQHYRMYIDKQPTYKNRNRVAGGSRSRAAIIRLRRAFKDLHKPLFATIPQKSVKNQSFFNLFQQIFFKSDFGCYFDRISFDYTYPSIFCKLNRRHEGASVFLEKYELILHDKKYNPFLSRMI